MIRLHGNAARRFVASVAATVGVVVSKRVLMTKMSCGRT